MKMKKQMMKLTSVLAITCICLLGSGCSGSVANSDKGQIKTIKDLRDGEIIVFNTDTIENMVYNPLTGGYSFNYVDTNGVSRTMTKELEPYFKKM